MHAFIQRKSQATPQGLAGRTDAAARAAAAPGPSAGTAMRDTLNQGAAVQSQLRLQRMINQRPAVVAQMALAENLAGRTAIQRQGMADDEELMQQKPASALAQREGMADEEELAQAKLDPVQKQGEAQREADEEKTLQGKFHQAQRRENRTGLPDQLKSGVENLSGYSLDDVRVHYNSAQPAQLNALAYAQGTDIHVAPGQERHLPHEAWHIVQQKQGRVQPTMQAKGVPINDDGGLEREADMMGTEAAMQRFAEEGHSAQLKRGSTGRTLQRNGGSKKDKGDDEKPTGSHSNRTYYRVPKDENPEDMRRKIATNIGRNPAPFATSPASEYEHKTSTFGQRIKTTTAHLPDESTTNVEADEGHIFQGIGGAAGINYSTKAVKGLDGADYVRMDKYAYGETKFPRLRSFVGTTIIDPHIQKRVFASSKHGRMDSLDDLPTEEADDAQIFPEIEREAGINSMTTSVEGLDGANYVRSGRYGYGNPNFPLRRYFVRTPHIDRPVFIPRAHDRIDWAEHLPTGTEPYRLPTGEATNRE